MITLESDDDVLDIMREFNLPPYFDIFDFWRAAENIGLMGVSNDCRSEYTWLDDTYYNQLLKNPSDLMEELF